VVTIDRKQEAKKVTLESRKKHPSLINKKIENEKTTMVEESEEKNEKKGKEQTTTGVNLVAPSNRGGGFRGTEEDTGEKSPCSDLHQMVERQKPQVDLAGIVVECILMRNVGIKVKTTHPREVEVKK
jgi:hypothetical protein